MDRYAQYSLRDFIQDDFFIQWAKYPDTENSRYWEAVRAAYPYQSPVMDQAAELVRGLSAFYPEVPDSEVEKARQAIFEQFETKKTEIFRWKRLYLAAAASVIFVLGIALWLRHDVTSIPFINKQLAADTGISTSNNGDSASVIALPDGSAITLSPNSSVRSVFDKGDRREVYLEGEAFFNVTKNPEKPFYVYANGLVTKVLGTKFKISAYPGGEVVKVEVSSGKVRVYSSETGKGNAESEGMTLTPNQQAVYNKKDQQLTRNVVEQPKVLITPQQLKTYTYTDTPISKIFEGLEEIYGIKVVYDKEKFKNCRLNMVLSDESLFEKLELIGKVVEARYNIIDGQVIIIGEGCSE